MNKNIKKLLCAAVSLAMAAGTIVLPITAANAEGETPIFEGDTVIKEWKFDFGATGTAAEDGWTAVTPDTHFDVGTSEYGFVGTKEEDVKLGDRLDGFGTQEMQMENDDGKVIKLAAGGSEGLNDGIGSTGADMFDNAGDVYYPARFALKAEDDTYFRVRATVTTLDPSKDAEVSLYTERKHPLFTDTKVAAGETKTVEFSVRPTPIYYQKSNPTGQIKDEMVNVCVLGANSALASLEIQQVEEYPVFWVLGDSTVTDGNCSLPFFRLQNYTGVGTGLTKYLPRSIAMVNEGEGGLNAADSAHFNMVSTRIKAGDYMYVEYGHNHKDDGPEGYLKNLDKYYNACQNAKGGPANLILVSPIERINQWDSTTSKYTHSLAGFADAAKQYVEGKIAAGATNIAYVDLNTYSLDFYNKTVADNGNDKNAIKFYFQTTSGGATDTTHPNDAGAENLAYEFIKAAKARVQETASDAEKAVLNGFLDNITDEQPNLVPESITSKGLGSDAWPKYVVGPEYTYPNDITSVTVENGKLKDMTVNVIAGMETYALGVVEIYGADGELKETVTSANNVDNSTGKGSQTVTFADDAPALADGDTYKAYTWSAYDDRQELIPEAEGGKRLSSIYTPIPAIKEHLITNEAKTGNEDFNFEGASYDGTSVLGSDANGYNGWSALGSGGKTLTLGENDSFKYTTIQTDGAKNGSANQGSFYISKALEKPIGTSGKYIISADMKYLDGGGMNVKFVDGNTTAEPWGTSELIAFTVAAGGKITANGQEAGQLSPVGFGKVTYILDMDYGTATVNVAGYDPVTYSVANYDTTSPEINPEKLSSFMFEATKVAAGIQVANLTVAELDAGELPDETLTAVASDDERGTVELKLAQVPEESGNTPEDTPEQASLASETELGANITASYNFGKLDITSDKEAKFVLLDVAYDENNALKTVQATDVEFSSAGSKSYSIEEGHTILLWNSLESMEPIMPAMIAQNHVGEVKTLTAKMNTVVTATATANQGYVFTAWLDSETGATISTEREYTFRLRDNVSLVANFAVQQGVEAAADFDITVDKPFVKVGTEEKVTISVDNIVDASGNPVSYTPEDIKLSASDGLTIADNVLTIPADFNIGDTDKKDIIVTCTVGECEKTVIVSVHSYDVIQTFDDPEDVWGFAGAGGAVINSEGALQLLDQSNASGSRTSEKTFDESVSASSKVHIMFDWKSLVESGKGRNSDFRLLDSNDNLIFLVRGNGNKGLFYSTTTADDTGYTSFAGYSQNWYSVDLTIDFTAKTLNGSISDAGGNVVKEFKDEPLANSPTNLSKLQAINTYSLAPMAIDNVIIKAF